MTSASTHLVHGAIAGAVGTTALNAATFLDMVLRGRPASSTPEQVVQTSADLLHVSVPGSGDQQEARRSGLGSLLGTMAGVSAGAALGGLRAAGLPSGRLSTLGTAWVLAMLAGNAPMTGLGVTDPRTWAATDWVADVLPHLAYAVAATATLEAVNAAPARARR